MIDDITKITAIYVASDDLIEIEGELNGEHGCYGTSENTPIALFLSDGTVLSVIYSPDDRAIWKIDVKERGSLLLSVEICTNENATPYSDIARFAPGLKWAYAVAFDGPVKRVD